VDLHPIVVEQVTSLLGDPRMESQGQNGHIPALLAGGAASQHRAKVVDELLDAAPGGNESIPTRFLEGPVILFGRGLVKDQEDGEIPEKHPGFPTEKAAKPVAIHGFATGVGKQDLSLAPGILSQRLQRITGLHDEVASPFKRHSQALDEVVMAGNDQQVHGEPGASVPW
jgi:hypothetical protein